MPWRTHPGTGHTGGKWIFVLPWSLWGSSLEWIKPLVMCWPHHWTGVPLCLHQIQRPRCLWSHHQTQCAIWSPILSMTLSCFWGSQPSARCVWARAGVWDGTGTGSTSGHSGTWLRPWAWLQMGSGAGPGDAPKMSRKCRCTRALSTLVPSLSSAEEPVLQEVSSPGSLPQSGSLCPLD